MPRARPNIGRRNRRASARRREIASQTEEQRLEANERDRLRMAERRAQESLEQHEARISDQRFRAKRARTAVSDELRQELRDQETISRDERRQDASSRQARYYSRLAFRYDPNEDYSTKSHVVIGAMNEVCPHCKALKFHAETKGMCCALGKVQLPRLADPPEPLKSLLAGYSTDSKHFLANIRKYNSCFQMTSFGANVINDNFMPTFKVQGQIYHRAGSLLPFKDGVNKFLQIYFIGDKNDELNTRCAIASGIKRSIVSQLQEMLHSKNNIIRLFKTAIDRMPSDSHKIVIRPDKTPAGQHERRFNAPSIDEVAILIVGEEFNNRDIVLHRRNEQLQRVSDTHRCYDPLQYPLIFWDGHDGYHFNIKMVDPVNGGETNKKVSAMNYYSYRLMICENENNHILQCRQLFHQFVVDMYAKIESERLLFIRLNQQKLRSEEYIHLRDAVVNDGNTTNVGRLTILPATHTGSPRHMHEYAQDAIAYVRNYGRPDLFITFTCNPAWEEIKNNLLPGQTPIDRHDVTARVFRQKLKSLMDFMTKREVFGQVRCWMYSVEWQKRGLPHAHILIWLYTKINSSEIDEVISAEIPDANTDRGLHEVVTKNMIHGPCGAINPSSPCMVDGKCSKRYPRALVANTVTGNDGYPLYKRRSPENSGRTTTIIVRGIEIEIDNRWVVPYCPLLSKTYQAHINVEYCNSVKSIKYICKYVNKGSDMAVFGVSKENTARDEITQYQIGRYISSNEAVWRILSFPIHERNPAVVHLAVHLENGQRIYFTEANIRDRAINPPATTLTAFFSLCQNDDFAKNLLYAEVPTYYTWNTTRKSFERRKRGKRVSGHNGIFEENTLGRIYTVHPNQAECFYLRLLLVNVRGPTSFQHLRTAGGITHDTYRATCQALRLLEDDKHWEDCLADACATSNPHQIRLLLAIILTTCSPSAPSELWEKYKSHMAEDLLLRFREINMEPSLDFTPDIYNQTLILIEDLCLEITNKLLAQLGMPSPNRSATATLERELLREQSYNTADLLSYVRSNVPKLTNEQKNIYDQIMNAANNQRGGLFFLDAPGGTGKTFLITLILATVRTQNEIALALASSGIASTLLPGGRTAHSALKLPLNLHATENPTCNISKTSGMGKVLQNCKIIVWDECTMAHKKSLEALDRTLQDLRGSIRSFGNALVLLAGDFRQTLPVIPRSTPADEIYACLKYSPLWQHVKSFKLTTNMRIQLHNDPSSGIFSRQLLEIGDGTLPADNVTGQIKFPQNFCTVVTSKGELIDNIFPNIAMNYVDHNWISERAILAAKNKDVYEINDSILEKIPSEHVTYKSVDVTLHENEAVNYPPEFLNSLDVPGLPPHILKLKIGVPVILLRNINPPKLCNGTRLAIKKMMGNTIEATILNGAFKGENVLLPRIPFIPSEIPFHFKRTQFPVRLAFAMTINKAQGQSLQMCGIDLETECFSHGQLYVSCSRVGKPSNLFIRTEDGKTKNIVYKQALQ